MVTQTADRSTLVARLELARETTDGLFRTVVPGAMYDRPIPERHRIVFYVGHLEAFDRNLFRRFGKLPLGAEGLDDLFAFGIDPVGGNLPSDVPDDWPRLQSVYDYRDRVRREVDDSLPEAEDGDGSLDTLLHVAIEHRLMHAETLSYILHQLPFASKVRGGERIPRSSGVVVPSSERIPAGSALLGMRSGAGEFGWDNEYDQHRVDVAEFEIDKYKVTNGQYLEFMADHGYQRRELWTEDAWKWLQGRGVWHPVFWLRVGDAWWYRSMFEAVPLALDWPVYVSHAEASAYAVWAGKVLPTEAQWQRAAFGSGDSDVRVMEAESWDPAPVHECHTGVSAFGVEGMFGNGWEWTSTAFAPFAGFQPFPFYKGYSADFFDGHHFVLKGGSTRTAACMLRPSFRNWFQPHYQYVYAGFRCVRQQEEKR